MIRRAGARGALTPYLLLLPALLVVLPIALGLLYVVDFSLRELDPSTFLLGESWTFANYLEVAERPVYVRIMLRSFGAALLVTAGALALGL
ncbi:MAG: hypothetical protein R3349_01740, partial [Geminicoccaceae bacterium]|nr:hypothetical protein [Geminicoccaceae bacterium]